MKRKLRNIIKEQIDQTFIGEAKKYKDKTILDELAKRLFETSPLLEDENSIKTTQDAITKIKNNEWNNGIDDFYNAFNDAITHSTHKEMLTPYSKRELSKMKLFKLNDYNIGFALKEKNNKHDEIVAVFNDEPNVKGIGDDLIKSSVSLGGCFLDHFDGFLSNFYKKLGFEEYDRDKFNSDYDDEGHFANKYGEQDIIYRVHKNCK